MEPDTTILPADTLFLSSEVAGTYDGIRAEIAGYGDFSTHAGDLGNLGGSVRLGSDWPAPTLLVQMSPCRFRSHVGRLEAGLQSAMHQD
jgi:hypothetical protein